MNLRGVQKRALDVMENRLETSEPRMTAMFAVFTRLTAGEEPAGAEALSPRRRDLRQSPLLLMLPMAALIVLIVGLVLGFTAGGASACASNAHAHATTMIGCGIAVHR